MAPQNLDERDRAILRLLQQDGRLTNMELAQQINLSPSACLRRVKLMEERGLISRYVMLLDEKAAGLPGTAFVLVTLDQQGRTALDAFEVDTGRYPKGRNGLMDLIQQPRDTTGWHGPYLDNVPKDPWGNDYIYECPGRHNPTSYDLSSMGPPGEDTVIGNWTSQKR